MDLCLWRPAQKDTQTRSLTDDLLSHEHRVSQQFCSSESVTHTLSVPGTGSRWGGRVPVFLCVCPGHECLCHKYTSGGEKPET